MSRSIKSFAHYISRQGQVKKADYFNRFQRRLCTNWKSNVIVGKERQQRVTTTLAYIAIYAALNGKRVGVFTKQKMYRHFLQIVGASLSESSISEHTLQNKGYSFPNGKIVQAGRREIQMCDLVIIDEFDHSPVESLQDFATMRFRQNFIATLTLREPTIRDGQKLPDQVARTFKILSDRPDAKYIEASPAETTFITQSDVHKHRQISKTYV